MKNCVRKIELDNSLTVLIYDTTRRYYEDYHLVRLEVECEVPVKDEYFESVALQAEVREAFGGSVCYRRTLEKMGVPYAEIERAREDLINSFTATSVPYFGSNGFPRRFILSELTRLNEKKLRGRV